MHILRYVTTTAPSCCAKTVTHGSVTALKVALSKSVVRQQWLMRVFGADIFSCSRKLVCPSSIYVTAILHYSVLYDFLTDEWPRSFTMYPSNESNEALIKQACTGRERKPIRDISQPHLLSFPQEILDNILIYLLPSGGPKRQVSPLELLNEC